MSVGVLLNCGNLVQSHWFEGPTEAQKVNWCQEQEAFYFPTPLLAL